MKLCAQRGDRIVGEGDDAALADRAAGPDMPLRYGFIEAGHRHVEHAGEFAEAQDGQVFAGGWNDCTHIARRRVSTCERDVANARERERISTRRPVFAGMCSRLNAPHSADQALDVGRCDLRRSEPHDAPSG